MWLLVACAPMLATQACATTEHVGRPPSADEIARINAEARGDLPPIRLEYLNREHACNEGPCSVGEPRPVPDDPPVDIQRILSANAAAMTVVTASGETRHTNLSLIAAVNTPDHAHQMMLRYTAGGAAAGLGFAAFEIGGLLAFGALLGSGPDQSDQSRSSSPTAGDVLKFTLPAVAAGAVIGLVTGAITQHRRRYVLGGAEGATSRRQRPPESDSPYP